MNNQAQLVVYADRAAAIALAPGDIRCPASRAIGTAPHKTADFLKTCDIQPIAAYLYFGRRIVLIDLDFDGGPIYETTI
jgi:hypothetical protein